jgi:chaperone required for assembly of F1-ATPase
MSSLRKRAYRAVAVIEEAADFAVMLDGKPALTSGRRPLLLPTRTLAEAVAAEWAPQEAEIDPVRMPLTRLAVAALDLVAPNRAEIAARIAEFAGTDLLCYRASEPEELVRRQQAEWQPLLDWAIDRYGAPLAITEGVIALEQARAALERLSRAVAALDDFALAALAAATAALGSLILGLAMLDGRIDGETAFALSQLDESFQAERWGEDEEAAIGRRRLRDDILAAARFVVLLRG